MLLIYTGNGKGKTSACTGQVVRALGRGFVVAFGQFMKREDCAGEQKMLGQLLGENFFASGAGFFLQEKDRPEHREKAIALMEWAQKKLDSVDVLIVDEALYALGCNLITQEELQALVASAKAKNVHLILSGRGLPDWLLEEADLVTEMGEIKHPYKSGGQAVKGIEF